MRSSRSRSSRNALRRERAKARANARALRRDANTRSSRPGRHFAARWAAKEALIKAWSASLFGHPPVLPEGIHRDIEVVSDAWGRPGIRLHGAVAEPLAGMSIHVSLTHDGDMAGAFVVLEEAPDA